MRLLYVVPHVLVASCLPVAVSAASDRDKNNPPRTNLSHPCSRPISRLVRKQLEKEILQPATREGHVQWPSGCPFEPGRELFANHEQQKSRKPRGGSSWSCGICGKTFINEHYLDLHLEHKHSNETGEEKFCLADYCEIFEVCEEERRRRPYRRGDEDKCNATQLARARHLCDDALMKCFPLDQPASRKLHAQMSRHFCQVLDCTVREERRKEEELSLVPVAVLLILIVFIGFLVFGIIVCCVDYSDDIVLFLKESGLLSAGFARKIFKAREETQKKIGMVDRTKAI